MSYVPCFRLLKNFMVYFIFLDKINFYFLIDARLLFNINKLNLDNKLVKTVLKGRCVLSVC